MTKAVRAQRSDGGATHSRILEAAGELFASTGFAETTNKMIAAQAEVDLASINYHFGSRNSLYQAVLLEAHNRFVSVESLRQLAASDLPAKIEVENAGRRIGEKRDRRARLACGGFLPGRCCRRRPIFRFC